MSRFFDNNLLIKPKIVEILLFLRENAGMHEPGHGQHGINSDERRGSKSNYFKYRVYDTKGYYTS